MTEPRRGGMADPYFSRTLSRVGFYAAAQPCWHLRCCAAKP